MTDSKDSKETGEPDETRVIPLRKYDVVLEAGTWAFRGVCCVCGFQTDDPDKLTNHGFHDKPGAWRLTMRDEQR